MKSKKFWLLVAVAACIGCCAIPFAALFAGAFGAGLLAWQLNGAMKEVLLCLLPLTALLIGYLMYNRKNHQRAKQSCCNNPTQDCQQTQCATKNNYNK